MSDPRYQHEEVVWCKCGGLFWPAEVRSLESLPVEIREGFLWMPKVVVKFFEEEGYEFVKDDKNIFPYECEKKEEFIKKGLARSRCKAKEGATEGWFAKFPKDVIHCERVTGGDVDILEKQPFAENKEKIDYSKIFGDGTPSKRGKSKAKEVTSAKKAKKRESEQPLPKAKKTKTASTPVRANKAKETYMSSDYQVKILTQPSTPYHIDLQKKVTTPASNAGYTCKTCEFATSRLNVFILHNKSHSEPPPKPKPSSSKGNKVKSERRKPTPSTAKLTANKRKPRPTKKQKEEQNQNQKRKEEEKKLILGDWSEDESEEEEEIKKLTGSIDNEDDDLFSFNDDKYDGLSSGSSPILDKSEDDLSKSPARTPDSEPNGTLDTKPVRTPDSEPSCAKVSSPMSSTLHTDNKTQITNKSPEAC